MQVVINYERLVDEYLTCPECGPQGHQALLKYAAPRAQLIFDELEIVRVGDADPYVNSAQLADDVYQGRLKLGPCPEHPHWDVWDMQTYRAWHDIEGHHALQVGFDRYGELAALRTHAHALLSAKCRLARTEQELALCALFNEIFYRVSCGIVFGDDVPPHRPVRIGPYAEQVLQHLVAW